MGLKCTAHGDKVYMNNGKIYCFYCGVEIPLDKLKKKK